MDLTKSNFYKNLTASNKEVKDKRALNLVRYAEIEKRRIIEELETNRFEIEAEYEELNDFSPKTSTDLTASKNTGEIKMWAEKTHNLKIRLRENNILLDIAKKEYKEYFGSDYKTGGNNNE